MKKQTPQNILYIGGLRDGPDDFREVKNYLEKFKHIERFQYVDPREIIITIDSVNKIQISFGKIDPDSIKTMYFAVSDVFKPFLPVFALFAKQKAIRVLDREITHTFIPNNKIHQEALVALHDIPVPKTFCCLASAFEIHYDALVSFLGKPFLAKDVFSDEGEGVFLIKNKEDLFKLNRFSFYACQEFLENSFDYRVVVIEERAVTLAKRIREKNEFRNNAHLGAKKVFLNLQKADPRIKKYAEKVASFFAIDVAGVDLLPSKGGLYFLEINHCPSFIPLKSIETKQFSVFVKKLLSE